MDIISQLQEQVNTIAFITLNTFGTLQRDAPPVRLSPNYPEPPANPTEERVNVAEQSKTMSAALVQAAKKFDALVAALPVSGVEEAQLTRIEELQAENEAVGQELKKQLEAAGRRMGRIKPSNGGKSSADVHATLGFDFAEWLRSTVTERDFVVMKMDVEGTEFDLLPRLFETGAICLIDELFLECHYNWWHRCCPGVRSPKYQYTYGQCLDLFSSLRSSGILVHQWW